MLLNDLFMVVHSLCLYVNMYKRKEIDQVNVNSWSAHYNHYQIHVD